MITAGACRPRKLCGSFSACSALVGRSRGDKLVVGKQPAKGRCLSSLTSSCQDDHGTAAFRSPQAWLDIARNPHLLCPIQLDILQDDLQFKRSSPQICSNKVMSQIRVTNVPTHCIHAASCGVICVAEYLSFAIFHESRTGEISVLEPNCWPPLT
jgi:hypothetical protein